MKLNEVLPELFFVHNGEVKYKWIQSYDFSTCCLISFNLLNSSLKENLYNISDSEKINNNEEVILWNINNFEFDFYSNKGNYWFFHDKNKDIYYNFMSFHRYIFLPKIFNKNQNYFYQGKIKFDVIAGKINEESIMFTPNNDNWMEISKVNGLLFKELNSFENIELNKDYILNINFNQNQLFIYINEINKNLNEQDSLSFEIKQTLKIIKFCILQSDFYNCLINIRSIRNLIFGYIYEQIFLPIYRKLEETNEEILWRKRHLEQIQETKIWFSSYDSDNKDYKNNIEINEQKLKNLVEWYNQFKGINEKKENDEIIEELINERKEYYKKAIYFDQETFQTLTAEKLSAPQIRNNKIINYLKIKILTEEEIISFNTANSMTNNSVHKNNYDRENFKHWYLNNNELNILLETLKIYLNIFIKFQENIKSYNKEIEELLNA